MSSRQIRILRNIAIGLAAIVILAITAAFFTVRTEWFRAFVKQKIITATEDGTGGKVELGSFLFEWRRLKATATNFVINGNEPAGSPPFGRDAAAARYIRLLTSLTRP